MESGSTYLSHRLIHNISITGVVLAEDFVAVSEKFNGVNSIKLFIVDNSSTNTACYTPSEKLKRKLNNINRSLHQISIQSNTKMSILFGFNLEILKPISQFVSKNFRNYVFAEPT